MGYSVAFQYFYTIYVDQAKVIEVSISSDTYYFFMLGNIPTLLPIWKYLIDCCQT